MNLCLSRKYLCLHMDDFLVKYIPKLTVFVGRAVVYRMSRYGPSLPQVSGSHVYESTEPQKYTSVLEENECTFQIEEQRSYDVADHMNCALSRKLATRHHLSSMTTAFAQSVCLCIPLLLSLSWQFHDTWLPALLWCAIIHCLPGFCRTFTHRPNPLWLSTETNADLNTI